MKRKKKMKKQIWATLAASALAILPPAAVQASDAAQTVADTIQSDLGVFVYPKADQDSAAQAKDTVACYESAKQRSGIDPKAPPPEAGQVEAQKGGAVKGAARGAARGAAVGEIANDDAGKGASVGAAGGAMRGRKKQKQANAAAQQQAEQQAAAAAAEQKATFNKAFSACMDARDYSVK
jgi:hypothetical protein